MLEQLHSNALD